jgi:uncharacterized protein YndB with AHSA1/START domain
MMKAKPDPSDSLVFECDFEEPPEKVWRALTEPQLLDAWLTEEPARAHAAEAEPATSQPAPSQPKPEYEILTSDPPRLVRYRRRDRDPGVGDASDHEVHSVVTFELEPRPMGGTHLRLTHGEFTVVAVPVPAMALSRITPITSARRWKARRASFAAQCCLRRAA